MESIRQIGHRKILLPFEQELCEQLGLSKEEYFKFLEYTLSQNGKRPKEYDNIPYIVNMPQALFVGGTASAGLTAFGQVVVGLALNLISYFLTPKPKAPKTPPRLTTPGQEGVRRFAPQTGFDSIQELAELGAVIPLVFAKYERVDGVDYGGVRVNTQLIWSQMRSLSKGQQIKAIFNLSSGELAARPDFNGYAIGDVLLKNYPASKFRLFFYTGDPDDDGKFRNGVHQYPLGILPKEKDRNGNPSSDDVALPLVDSDRSGSFESNTFCATRTPSTQNVFGNYNPVPNSMRFMLPYELILVQDNLSEDPDTDTGLSIKDTTVKKREKIETNFPRYQAIIAKNGSTTQDFIENVNKNDLITFQISDHDPNKEFEDKFSDWGTEDVASSVNADRENTDDSLAIGEQYLIGTAIGSLISANISNSGEDGIWQKNLTKQFTFKIDEPGDIQVRSVTQAHNPYELLLIQKCAIGVITNSFKCTTTEIGLKSVVNRQITGFANVNSHPGYWQYYGPPDNAGEEAEDGVVHKYEKKNGNISLGQMSKYVKRLSFFELYARAVDDDEWTKIGDKPFAVLGRTPQPQYNFIRINHTNDELREFKFQPVPGNFIKRQYREKDVNLLTGTKLTSIQVNDSGIQSIYFNGRTDYKLTDNAVSNPEWFLGEIPQAEDAGEGKVLALNRTVVGTPRTKEDYIPFETTYEGDSEDRHYVYQRLEKFTFYPKQRTVLYFYYDDELKGKYTFPNRRTGNFAANNTDFNVVVGDIRYSTGDAITDSDDDFISRYKIVLSRLGNVTEGLVSGYPKTVSPSGGHGSGLQVKVELFDNGAKRWEITNKGSGYKEGDEVTIPFDSFGNESVFCLVEFGNYVTEPWPEGQNLNPFDAIADYIKFDAERPSHLDQPEHQITYVNEMIRASDADDAFLPYSQLSNVGIKMNSSKEFTNFSQLSVYVKNGIKVENLINNRRESSNLFPNIAYHLLTDSVNGAGNLIGEAQINKQEMEKAAEFCEANKLYWDGVITQQQNIREFIYQNATFCLLDFTIKGGQFSLTPTVPVTSNNEINREVLAKDIVKALFTDGNTRSLKVSFLSPEERQLFQARVLYRDEVENGFAKTEVLDLRLGDNLGGSQSDPREVFDMSNFCTSEKHARTFAEYALLVRKFVDHGISFETTPESAMSLEPGDYIRFFSEITHNDRFENGYISADGTIQSQGNTNPIGANIFYWRAFNENGSDFGEPREAVLTADNNKASSQFRNSVFTIQKTDTADRIYKIESITYTEDGFVQLTATHQPLDADGKFKVLKYNDNIFSDED
jgi:hypothetical protein